MITGISEFFWNGQRYDSDSCDLHDPASYNFVLMVFPVCVLAARLLRARSYGWLAALIVAYLGIGFPLPVPNRPLGLTLLLYVPRLPLMMAILFAIYAILWRKIGTEPCRRTGAAICG